MRDSQEILQPSDRRPWRFSPEEDIEIDFLSNSSLIFQNMTNENTTKFINRGLLMNCTHIEGHGRREYHPRSKCGCWSFWVSFLSLLMRILSLLVFGWGFWEFWLRIGWEFWAFWFLSEDFEPFGFWVRLLSISAFEALCRPPETYWQHLAKMDD